VTALEDGKEMLAHESLMLHYSEPLPMLETVAADLEDQFLEDADEDAAAAARTGVRTRAQRAARAATVSDDQTVRAMAVRGVEKRRVADVTTLLRQTPAGVFCKECCRKKERNVSGRFEMQIEVGFLTGPSEGRRVWMTIEEFKMLQGRGVDVEVDTQTGPGERRGSRRPRRTRNSNRCVTGTPNQSGGQLLAQVGSCPREIWKERQLGLAREGEDPDERARQREDQRAKNTIRRNHFGKHMCAGMCFGVSDRMRDGMGHVLCGDECPRAEKPRW
jgi:hypothetical protein